MGVKRCAKKDYQPSGDELYICKRCKRRANKKGQLCLGKKVHALLEEEKKKKPDQSKKKKSKKKKK